MQIDTVAGTFLGNFWYRSVSKLPRRERKRERKSERERERERREREKEE